jgi:N-glycosylase/DNA lyase
MSVKNDEQDDETVLREYLRLEEPLPELYREWARCDPIFEKAAEKFEGVRMLRQDPTEIIFTFICSSNNSIAR